MMILSKKKLGKYVLCLVGDRKYGNRDGTRRVYYYSDSLEELLLELDKVVRKKSVYWEYAQVIRSIRFEPLREAETLLFIKIK